MVLTLITQAAAIDPNGCPNVGYLLEDAESCLQRAIEEAEASADANDVSAIKWHAEALILGARGLTETPHATEVVLDECLSLLKRDVHELGTTEAPLTARRPASGGVTADDIAHLSGLLEAAIDTLPPSTDAQATRAVLRSALGFVYDLEAA